MRGIFSALGVLLMFALFGAAGLLWSTLPPNDGSATISGLSARVEVSFDEHAIPFIRAGNLFDAASALGYLHARDRIFQMELMRRMASGRLSELVGPATLPIDTEMRILGLRRAAEADYAMLPVDTRRMLESYAAGVNAWITARGRFSAAEFIVLGAPEPWQPVDSLLWAKTMGMWLSTNWRQELARWQLKGHLPQPVLDQLWPPQPGTGEPWALHERGPWFASEHLDLSVLAGFPQPFTQPDHASNEWAVDGNYSTTGSPLLAGDPHLGFGFPSLWYLARIDTPQLTLAGATAPGVPGVVLGRNSDVAWTFTTTGADVQDVFIETPVGQDEYQTPDGPKPFVAHQEIIRVRGQPDRPLIVRETRHGPVISDLIDPAGPILAVSMTNLAPGDTAAAGLMALNTATTVEEAGQAASRISSPVQNLLVADRRKIALFVTGRVPIRKSGDGFIPVDGASGAYDWTGFASGEQLPHQIAPGSGRLVNANERVAPAAFPVFLGKDWFGDWRAQRIRQLLSARNSFTVADFTHMQVDVTSNFAQRILPALLSIHLPDGPAARALKLLDGWDGSMTMEAAQPLLFQAWVVRFYRALTEQAGLPAAQAGTVAPLPEVVAASLAPGQASWCGGDCAEMLTRALQDAVRSLSAEFGPDPATWRWGAAHQAVFAHPFLGAVPGLGAIGTMRIPVPGSSTTIFATAGAGRSFSAMHGPEFRGVYDLADLDRSRFMMAPGESGNLLSTQSSNLLIPWREGQTFPLGPRPGQVTATLVLMP